MVALDVGGAGAPARLDDVGVERALHEELDVVASPKWRLGRNDLGGDLFEGADELGADDLALGLGIGDAFELGEELLRRVDGHQADAGGGHVVALHLLALALAQQSVVDEHARELVAHGTVHERRGDRGVDATRQTAEHVMVAHALADLGDRVVDDVGGRPRGRDAGTDVQEPLEHGLAVRGVQHLGVPLHAEEAPLGVLEGGDLGAVGAAGHREPRRRDDDRVAVRHPHRLANRLTREEHRVGVDGGRGATELGALGALHRAAERLGHRLEAVTDAEHRHAGVEERGIDRRRTVGVDAGRTAREDHRRGLTREELGHGHLVRHDLAVDLRLAHAAGDQLRVLSAEVDDEDERVAHRSIVHGTLSAPGRPAPSGCRSGGRRVPRPGERCRTLEAPVGGRQRGHHAQSRAESEAVRDHREGRRSRLGRPGRARRRRGHRRAAADDAGLAHDRERRVPQDLLPVPDRGRRAARSAGRRRPTRRPRSTPPPAW